MRIFLGLLLMVIAGLGIAAWWVSRPAFDEPYVAPDAGFAILPLDAAATLAMSRAGDVYLVVAADAEEATVVDLNRQLGAEFADTLEAFSELGFHGLAGVRQIEPLTVPLASLDVPLRTSYPHIAAGTNFRAHAEEVGLEGDPFVFPKLTEATAWNAPVPLRARLDYEVELCAVTLAAYTPEKPSRLGYLLCNDFTDRWSLLRHIDLDTPMGRSGFPDAKGGAGMLPVGPFLVIPRNAASYYPDLEMTLGLNGELRQRARAGMMIWSPDEIARKALGDCRAEYTSTRGTHVLTSCEAIAPGTLILTGTPAGVMFHFASIWSPLAYLRNDDEVVAFADHLGVLRNRIAAMD